MKKISLLIVWFMLPAFATTVFAQTQPGPATVNWRDRVAKIRSLNGSPVISSGKTDVVYTPQSATDYIWDGAAWECDQEHAFSYHWTGTEIKDSMEFCSTPGTPYRKLEHTLDSHNNTDSETDWLWSGSSWFLSYGNRLVNDYSPAGDVLTMTTETYNSSTFTWDPYSKSIYTYAASGEMETEVFQLWDGTAWVNGFQYLYTYEAGEEDSVIIEKWTGSAWEKDNLIVLDWYNYEKILPSSEEFFIWSGSVWNPVMRTNTVYSLYDSQVSATEIYSGGVWQFTSRTTITNDARYNQVEKIVESWSGTAWEFANGDQWTYLYDVNDNILEKVYIWYNSVIEVYENLYKIVYSGYTVDADKPGMPAHPKVWPNPANTNFSIETEGDPISHIMLTATDGKTYEPVISSEGNTSKVWVENIPSGLYVLTTHSTSGISQRKIMIQ